MHVSLDFVEHNVTGIGQSEYVTSGPDEHNQDIRALDGSFLKFPPNICLV
jgi:hypothetical protein